MIVETYEVLGMDVGPDGTPFNESNDPESLALIEALGLEGQKKFTNIKDIEDRVTVETRIPYRQMTAEEGAIFAVLFPVRTSIEKYSGEPIPLRILQVAAHAKSCGLELWVLHEKGAKTLDDPVLIGSTSEKTSWGGATYTWYLLGRWGNAIEPIEELRKIALPRLVRRLELELKAIQLQVEQGLRQVENQAEKWLDDPTESTFNFTHYPSLTFPAIGGVLRG